MLVTGPKGSVLEKRRVGPTGRAEGSIVGVWRYQHYAGAVAYERYLETGELQFRLALSSYPGCYSADGGKLTLAQPSAATTPYEINGERLTLVAQGRRPFVYRRVPGGASYPREALTRVPVE
jgi:hypothetical protein